MAALLLLGGCGAREPKVIKPPKDAAAVIEPFLKELAAGNKDKAAAFVTDTATDELDNQFAGDHKKLAAAGKITPRFITLTGDYIGAIEDEREGDRQAVTLVYAAKSGEKWTTATVRAYKFQDEPYKVEYWRVANEAPKKPYSANVDAEEMEQSEKMMNVVSIILSVLGVIGIALLVWLVRRRPHLMVPEIESEPRRSASTIRELEE